MCNFCNSGVYTRTGYGCGCGTTTVNGTATVNGTGRTTAGYTCGYWNGGYQRMCRDACGNILTRNTCGYGCHQHCCPCWQPCHCCCGNGNGNGGGTAGNNGGTAGNGNGTTGNGVFRCITFCGYGNNLTQQTATNNAAAYYAQQYGLTCDDNAECVYTF